MEPDHAVWESQESEDLVYFGVFLALFTCESLCEYACKGKFRCHLFVKNWKFIIKNIVIK